VFPIDAVSASKQTSGFLTNRLNLLEDRVDDLWFRLPFSRHSRYEGLCITRDKGIGKEQADRGESTMRV